jgi:hypothetical protein
MNYLRLAIVIMFAVTAQGSYADSIPTFQITQAQMFLNTDPDGSGHNVGFYFTGPGVTISGLGSMYCAEWCSGLPSPEPSGYLSQISVSLFYTAIIGGKTYDTSTLSINNLFNDMEGGGLNASASGSVGAGNGFLQFNLVLPTNGRWNLNFAESVDEFGRPVYSFTQGSFTATAPLLTPEPATVGMMLTGIVGIAGVVKRKATLRQ